MNRADIYFIDFEDSFSHNIVSELYQLNILVSVHSHTEAPFVIDQLREKLESGKQKCVLILGPGPGHPREYGDWVCDVMDLLGPNLFVMGICLGHQLFWWGRGLEVVRCERPVHGQAKCLQGPFGETPFSDVELGESTQVQVYNSLMLKVSQLSKKFPEVKLLADGDQVMATWMPGVVTYQFHPESVGTSCPKAYFKCIQYFLYND